MKIIIATVNKMNFKREDLRTWKTLPNTFKGLIIGGYLGSVSMIVLIIVAINKPYINDNYSLIPLLLFFFLSSLGAYIGKHIKKDKTIINDKLIKKSKRRK